MKNLFQILCSVLLCIALACTAPQKEEPAESMAEAAGAAAPETTQTVLDHHLAAVGENDLQAIMEDYTEESIIITPDTTYRGMEQISSFFEAILPGFPTEGTVLEMDRMFVEGDVAYILWQATTPSLEVPFGTDTFIIEEGKIKIQTFAAIINPIEN